MHKRKRKTCTDEPELVTEQLLQIVTPQTKKQKTDNLVTINIKETCGRIHQFNLSSDLTIGELKYVMASTLNIDKNIDLYHMPYSEIKTTTLRSWDGRIGRRMHDNISLHEIDNYWFSLCL